MVAWCWLIQVTNINQPCRMVYYITFYIIWLITWVYRGVPWVLRGFTTFKTSNFQQHQCCTKRRAGSGASRRSIGKAMARIGNDWRRYIEAWTKGTIRWVQPTNFLIGGWFHPLWKIWKSVRNIIRNIWKNRKCYKPPTSFWCDAKPIFKPQLCLGMRFQFAQSFLTVLG